MRSGLRAALSLSLALAWSVSPQAAAGAGTSASQRAPRKPAPTVEAAQGTIVRWSVPGTRSCSMAGRTWRAVQETCYYPIDVARKPGAVPVVRHGARGSVATAQIHVTAVTFDTEHIQLGDIPQAHPSTADLQRNAREQGLLARTWRRPEGPARFALPLGPPSEPLPAAKGFGDTWVFDTTPPSTETHTGLDYAARAGAPVLAMADGTVVLAQDLFYSGGSVIVDHGNGLFTAYLHLSETKVRAGQEVKKGERIGLVGATGRTTGPHLHVAVRWHGARVDPRVLQEDPAKIRAIGEGSD